MLGLNRLHLASAVVALLLAACSHQDATLTCPPPGDICYDKDGNPYDRDGNPIGGDGGDPTTDDGADGDGGDGADTGPTDTGQVEVTEQDVCFCTITADDTDGDCVSNANEVTLGTDPTKVDTDGDGVRDGCEDRNHDGHTQSTEWDPTKADTDGDCIPDGLEDKDHNGHFALSLHETSPILKDSDRDGIDDGVEDANCNGVLDNWVDADHNGCFNAGDTQGETDPALNDTDGDFVGDGREDANQNGHCEDTENSCAFIADTDCDKLPDGSEDSNRNGIFNTGETNPRAVDSDGDGIADGTEDTNLNGVYEPGSETDPRNIDSDGDTLQDGLEDANHNGIVEGPQFGGNGCWNGVNGAETDPRKQDSDGDGIHDNIEDKNKNGICDTGDVADPNAPGGVRTNALVEECAFLTDSDCDGISDGKEDKNLDGIQQQSETDATYNDTDRDGLIDGCPPATDLTTCEDRNNNGNVDPGETDPRSVDTDLDGLTDRCEVQFDPSNCTSASCVTNPLAEDTDGDGKFDGEEDANHDCKYEPALGETDPRVANPPPPIGSIDYPKSQVCDAENLKQLTFAAAPDPALDYRVAFEVEKFNGTEADYSEQAFGIELSSPNNIIVEDDPNDMVWGHIFESPAGVVVDQATSAAVNRNVYGFVYATADTTPLDLTLDDLREKISANYGGAVVEVSNVPSRPAHDDHPGVGGTTTFRVFRAQRQYRITVASSASGAQSAVKVRQDILGRIFLPQDELGQVRPDTILGDTTDDPVYGAVSCPSNPQCYQHFTMYIGAVQRPQQQAPSSVGVTLYVVAITPDDSTANVNDTTTRLYNERLTRLEDLTGGSAVARFEARRSSNCEDRNASKARADLLFVVDDSRSMQAVVGKLQQASRDAQAVLTANANNVDFRVAMTTTNPSTFGRDFCTNSSQTTASPASNTFDPTIGCMGWCNDPATCASLRSTEAAATFGGGDNHFIYQLPGGGGTFYYEDTAWMDCKATTGGTNVIDACNSVAGFAPFYNGQPRVRLPGNAGFLGSDPDANCPTFPVNLNFDATDAGTSCAVNPAGCCQRLAAECDDGPRVLSSQMCDLIRAMGGRPDAASGAGGARPHSQNEEGVRSARRLITSMGLAYPLDHTFTGTDAQKNHLRLNCTSTGTLDACDDDNDCGSFDFCDTTAPKNNKVGTCKPTGNCQACDPRGGTTTLTDFKIQADPTSTIPGASGNSCTLDSDCGRGERCNGATCIVDCKPVPMVTIFLSDEEDYIFKDECESSHTAVPSNSPLEGWQQFAENTTDESQLYTDCYFKDTTNLDANGYPLSEPCINPTDADPLAYCRGYVGAPFGAAAHDFAGFATGYDPDTVPAVGGSLPFPNMIETMDWRDYNAQECATFDPPDPSSPAALAVPTGTSCLDDPCRIIGPDQATCTNSANSDYCRWSPLQGRCMNFCEFITGNVSGTTQPLATRQQQRTDCEANAACYFDTGFGRDGDPNSSTAANNTITNQLYACQPRIPLNDCQACKRAFRRYGSVIGTNNGTNLAGLGDVGPAYAIVRERGKPGFRDEGGRLPQDECAGGFQTWGRGDGQSFRDIAVDTLGRAQNVCASSYQDFMQLLVTDIVALSAPYKLAESPIAATIKVGIGRLEGDGHTWDYIEVPRSNSQGFVYDATSNSLGFKSDPIDGVCPGFSCSQDGTITDGEINAARNISVVPRANDLVFISYRFWRPVPCVDGCAVNETCVRSQCPPALTSPPSCTPATVTTDCPVGAGCDATNHCFYDCTDDGYLERCVPNPCGECQTYNSATGTCTSPSGPNPQCSCFDEEGSAINCNPVGPNTCPPGLFCDETCVCLVSSVCTGGFNPDGSVRDCNIALGCCSRFAACDAQTSQVACNSDPGACEWDNGNGKCVSKFTECCQPGETAVCFQPVEDPSRTVFGCQGGECSCTTTQSCVTDDDCVGNGDAFGNGAVKCLGDPGNKHCDCNPVTQSCLTDSGGSCACKQTPG